MREVRAVPFGSGLDRATGALATDPASFFDVRNVIPKDMKLEARGGLTAVGAELTDTSDVVGIFPFRAIKGGIGVAYNRTTRALTVWRLDGNGAWVELLGTWATLLQGAGFPLVTGAESKGKLFLAHDEPLFNYRAQTVYVDPEQPSGSQLIQLLADFDGDEVPEAVYFRGVRAYLAYMWGWGHGANLRPNAPEIVRYSEGADPTTWPKNYYFIAGAADEAVTNCGAAGGRFAVMKASEWYAIDGDNPQNFTIRPMEQVHGCLNGRLGLEYGGAFYYWSETGPRVTTGGFSVDLGLLLELDAPEPATLPARGDEQYGWVFLDPLRRLIMFGFPDIDGGGGSTRVYALSVRDPQMYRWSYLELAQPVYAVGVIMIGAPIVGAVLTGWASSVVAADDGLYQTGRQVEVAWVNNALIGGEFAQVWRRLSGGSWEVVQEVPALGSNQVVTINGPNKPWQALADYDVAIRYIKEGALTPGFEGNPDAWTHADAADGKTTVETSCETPVINGATWEPLQNPEGQRVTFDITLEETGVQIELEDSPNPITSFSNVQNDAALPVIYEPPMEQAATYRNYRVKATRAGKETPYSNILLFFLGPVTDPIGSGWGVFQDTNTNDFIVFLKQPYNAQAWAKIEIEAREEGGSWSLVYSGGGASNPDSPLPPSSGGLTMPIGPLTSPATFDNATRTGVRWRAGLAITGSWVWGQWSDEQLILLTNEAPPATPAGFTGTTYNKATDIEATFAAGGTVGRLMYYPSQLRSFSSAAEWSLAEVNDAATLFEFNDLAHEVLGAPEGAIGNDSIADFYLLQADWDYKTLPGTPAPDIELLSFAITRTGGRAKISATPATESVPKVLAGAPTALAVVTAGPGQIKASWVNGLTIGSRHQVRWGLTAGGATYQLAPMWAWPTYESIGPWSGYVALPAPGTSITVRVWGLQAADDGWEYWTAYAQQTFVLP